MSGLLRNSTGNASIGFAVLAPILVLLTVGLVDLGRVFLLWSDLDYAAQSAARFASVNGASSARPADATEVKSFARARLSGVQPKNAVVAVEWLPDTESGSEVRVAVMLEHDFFLAPILNLSRIRFSREATETIQ